MPTKLFDELESEKKERIIRIASAEFSKFGYDNSSTNRIVKDSGISKGSLFQYFQSKEELYFYILDIVLSELLSSLKDKLDSLSEDLFQRVIEYSELEFSWYIQNPEKYKLIVTAFTKNESDICRKVDATYGLIGENIYYQLLGNIDSKMLKWDKKKTIDILKWFLKGFNEEFIGKVEIQNLGKIDVLMQEYVQCLTEYIELLKQGLL